ncbi:MAG: TonB-dependent receptor [Candidatus Cyclobacteriaceae bacterium M2_1C_046]
MQLLFFLIIGPWSTFAQPSTDSVIGKVTDADGNAVPGITVLLKETRKGSATDESGNFIIEGVAPGKYKLQISGIGFEHQEIAIKHPSPTPYQISLVESVKQLQNVVVTSDKQSQSVKATGLNVSVISTEQFQDLNMDVNQIIGIASGINIRETGGLGSNFELSLNGLSGNQVRYFIDGIPMEFFGSALSLNNMPANMIKSIQIYKGVVPIHLAADALGGAINIVTPSLKDEFLDVSYSYGSFNTHRASAFGQVSNEQGMFLRFSSFFNHSDNDYWMNNVPVADTFGNITGYSRFRRFHDEYTSGSINLRAGLIGKKFADELSIDFTYAGNENNIQHPDVSVNRTYGGLTSRNTSYMGVLRYNKSFSKLEIKANALAGHVEEVVYDTISRRYNWKGEFKDLSDNVGEYYGQQSIFHIQDQFIWANIDASYNLLQGHNLRFNLSHNQLKRNGYDEINENNLAFTSPNELFKDMGALSYEYLSSNNKFQATVFGKQYFFNGLINTQEYIGDSYQNVETKANLVETGYGASARYTINPNWTMKFSFEKAYRMPEPDEILGNGMFIDPNPSLTAESSHNLNYGLIFNKDLGRSRIQSEANVFYRPTEDFIRFINDRGILGRYYNVANVRILGVESSNLLKIKNKYLLGLNWTYQSITDRTESYEGLPNDNIGEKIPNTPYFFWNLRAGYNTRVTRDSRISFTWSSRYIHEFYLYWERFGNRNDKNEIPTQFVHDLDINYSFNEGKYNASLAARNIFDANAYDNFNIQKPGRAFYLKFRYYLNNN